MIHPEDLLKNIKDSLAHLPANYDQQQQSVKNIDDSYASLLQLNGQERMDKVLNGMGLSAESAPVFKERLIGKYNNLISVGFLNKGLEVARTVCRVIKRRGEERIAIGTGFMVSPTLMMTNEHVIGHANLARQYYAEFDYNDPAGSDTKYFEFDPDSFFIADTILDFCVVAVKPVAENYPEMTLSQYGWNPLKPAKDLLYQGKPLSIIQHPEGQPKMIAFRDSRVVDIQSLFIHYTTDTQKGSSGSPVTNDQWRIVALHRSGVPKLDENGNIMLTKGGVYTKPEDEKFIIWKANQGVIIDSILNQIAKTKVPDEQRGLKEELLQFFVPVKKKSTYKLPGSSKKN